MDARLSFEIIRVFSIICQCRNGVEIWHALNFDEITYYVKPSEKSEKSWDEVPEEIKANI